jgi:hypothetical protein
METIQIKGIHFEILLHKLECKFPVCVEKIRNIYNDRFGLTGSSIELVALDEKITLLNEFFIKFGVKTISPVGDIASIEGDQNVFLENVMIKHFSEMENEIW